MAYATHQTAYAEREAVARQLDEGKLVVEILAHRLQEAERRLDMAANRITTTQRQLHVVVTSDSSLVCRQFREKAQLDAKIHQWGSEVVTAEAGFTARDLWLEDQQSVVSHSSAERAYSCQGGHTPLQVLAGA
jgi:hypothetical protein